LPFSVKMVSATTPETIPARFNPKIEYLCSSSL